MKSATAIWRGPATAMIGIMILVLAGSLQALSAAEKSADLTVEQVLDQVESKYTNSKFSADFIQNSTIKAMDIRDVATGKVYIKYPGKMRWEYEKPDRQIYITDGENLWVYRPDDNQVQTGKAPSFFKEGKGASFLSDIRLLRQKFDVSLEEGKGGQRDLFYHLKLIPFEKTMDISAIRLLISKKTFNVLQVATQNFYGDETRIDLINSAFGVELEDSLFSFKIPEGADVLQIDE